jgi:hypothetical protein
MPIDPNVLLNPTGIAAPNPLALAMQGLTLSDLLTRVQGGQMDLEGRRQSQALWSDPAFIAAVSGGGMPGGGDPAAQNGASAPQMPPGMSTPSGPPGMAPAPGNQAGDGSGAPSGSLADALRRNPIAAPAAIKAANEFAKTRAEMAEQIARTGKLNTETKIAGLTSFGNTAFALASQEKPITPMQASILVAQAKSLGTPPLIMSTMPPLEDQQGFREWAATLGTAATTPEQQTKIWEVRQTTPGNVREKAAQTAKIETETAQLPRELAAREMSARASATSAGAAATNAATNRMQYTDPLLQHVGNPEQGFAAFNPKEGSFGQATAPGQAKRTMQSGNALAVIAEARPLINIATGSGVGARADEAAALIGRSPAGADAIAKLRVLQANLMMNQPRMEGPQSDRDVQLYREAAGKIGDPTTPRSQKLAALDAIENIHRRYVNNPMGTAAASTTRVDTLPSPSSVAVGTIATSDNGVKWRNTGTDWVKVQ